MNLSPDERLLTAEQQLDYAAFLQSPGVMQRPGSLAPSFVAEVRPEQLLSQELLAQESFLWDDAGYQCNALIQLTVQVGSQVQTWYVLNHIGRGLGPTQFVAVYDDQAPAQAAYAALEDEYNPEKVATTVREMIAAVQQPHMQN